MQFRKWSLLLLWLVARLRRAFFRLGFRLSSHLSLLAFAKVDTMSILSQVLRFTGIPQRSFPVRRVAFGALCENWPRT